MAPNLSQAGGFLDSTATARLPLNTTRPMADTVGSGGGGSVTFRNWRGQGEFQLLWSLSLSLTSCYKAVAWTFIPTSNIVPR